MSAVLVLDGWAGRERHPVEILKETPKRYKIKLLSDCTLPGARRKQAGDVVYVPKYAVRQESEPC